MNKDTVYCSFVSIHYIICECGETFPSEDSLKSHLEREHGKPKPKVQEVPALPSTAPNVSKKPQKQVFIVNYVKSAPGGQKNLQQAAPVRTIAPKKMTQSTPKPIIVVNKVKSEPEIANINISQDDYTAAEITIKEEFYEMEEDQSEITIAEDQSEITIAEDPEQPGQNILQLADGSTVVVQRLEQLEGKTEETFDDQKIYTFKADQIKGEVVILDQELEEHNYHVENKPDVLQEYFFCDVCGKGFTSPKSLLKHASRQHAVRNYEEPCGESSRLMCDVCGKGYANDRTCPCKRKKKVPNQTRFHCQICSKSYGSNAVLRYHQRVHTGEKPYQCSYCPKKFTMPLFLQIHTRIHTGERPYQCDQCEKAFTNKAALLRHERVHTGVKPYVCPQCGKAFTQSNSMKLHVRTVHLKLPAPYKSKARKLKSMNKMNEYKGSGRRPKPKPEMQILEVQDDEYIIEEIPYQDDEDNSIIVDRVLSYE